MIEPIKRSRISVRESVYHQQADSQPVSVESAFSRWLNTDEQPWIRKSRVGEQWQSLETGWLEHAGMMLIENNEGHFTQQIPTEEERVEAAAKVIEISCSTNTSEAAWLVLPGESLRVHPANLQQIEIRCQKGEARYTLTLFPV